MHAPTAPKRRWFRFSLRALLVLIAIIAIPLAWKVNQVRHQRNVANQIAELGGKITWSRDLRQQEPPGPKWLRRWLGDDFFATVHGIVIDETEVTDATLADLASLPDLKSVCLRQTLLTDQGIASLARASHLDTLYIDSSTITDAGLENLENLQHLKNLILAGKQFTDVGIRNVARLRSLGHLSLSSVPLTPAVLAEISKMSLTVLELSETTVNDSQLKTIAGLVQLRSIALTNTNSGDPGLTQLGTMPNLTLLVLDQTELSIEGEKQLRRALPGCTVLVKR